MVIYGNQMEKTIKRISHINWVARRRYAPPEVIVLTGCTGSGKTRMAAQEGAIFCDYDSRYPWGHYEGQEVVCYDEYDGQLPLSTLLKQLDGYKITVQIPYEGNKPWIPKKVFICSNKAWNTWYPAATLDQREALWRRFDRVTIFEKNITGGMSKLEIKVPVKEEIIEVDSCPTTAPVVIVID